MVTTPRLNYLILLDEGENRLEIMDGELVRTPSPEMDHQEVAADLGTSLSMFVREHDLGRVYFASTDVMFSDANVAQPDLLYISKERQHIRTQTSIQGAPDLIVEILSPSSARWDWGHKRELYARHGVREYWIVDPTNHLVTVMELQDGKLEIDQTVIADKTAHSSALEGFEIDLAEIFAD